LRVAMLIKERLATRTLIGSGCRHCGNGCVIRRMNGETSEAQLGNVRSGKTAMKTPEIRGAVIQMRREFTMCQKPVARCNMPQTLSRRDVLRGGSDYRRYDVGGVSGARFCAGSRGYRSAPATINMRCELLTEPLESVEYSGTPKAGSKMITFITETN
jgi:hypothetical protein